jgi:hypothetical protein
MSRWRNRQTPAVESRSFAGSRPALDTGRWRHTSLRTRRLVQWEFESPPGPPVMLPWRNRQTQLAQNECQILQVRFLPGVPHTRPDGDSSSLQNCDSEFNSSRVCQVGDAERSRFESRLSLHRRARSDGNAFWSRKPALRERPDGGSTPPPSAKTLKFLIFCARFIYYVIAVLMQAIQFGRMPQGTNAPCAEGP